MESEKDKLIRAYMQGVKDGAATVLLLAGQSEMTVEAIRGELERFRIDNAEAAVEEIMVGLPPGALVN